jgi:hypothetical protein
MNSSKRNNFSFSFDQKTLNNKIWEKILQFMSLPFARIHDVLMTYSKLVRFQKESIDTGKMTEDACI